MIVATANLMEEEKAADQITILTALTPADEEVKTMVLGAAGTCMTDRPYT